MPLFARTKQQLAIGSHCEQTRRRERLACSNHNDKQEKSLWLAAQGRRGAASVQREAVRTKTDRAALARCMRSLAPGDVVLVTKLDRLPRSTRDLLNTLDAIAKAGAAFKSLGDPWADMTIPHGRLLLTVLGGLAEFERHLILSRTEDGSGPR